APQTSAIARDNHAAFSSLTCILESSRVATKVKVQTRGLAGGEEPCTFPTKVCLSYCWSASLPGGLQGSSCKGRAMGSSATSSLGLSAPLSAPGCCRNSASISAPGSSVGSSPPPLGP